MRVERIRQPAVAGMFYPGQPDVLDEDVRQMLGRAPRAAREGGHPKALIVPHAGYIYSGPVAASAYARLQACRGTVERVVLLGPAHRVAVHGLALPDAQAFATPLGVVPLDQEAAALLARLPQVTVSALAHAPEHSLEVQLPFLQKALGAFKLVPLVVGYATAEQVSEVLETLWGGPETLIVISSDLSHYLPYDDAREVDRRTADAILALSTDIGHEQACGATPVNGLLLAARRHGLKPELLDLRNSGDTAGDRSQVVGYSAFAFVEGAAHAH